MKKLSMILLLAACLCGLSACGKEDEAAIPEPEQLHILEERALPEFTAEDSLRMINLMNSNRALVADDTLYCLDFDQDYQPLLAAYTIGEGLTERRVLAEGCIPECLSEYQGRLYYINAYSGDRIESISTDGGDRLTLRDSAASYLQLAGGEMYYCDQDGRFCRAELDGGGESLVIGEPCCYPFLIGQAVLYQQGEGEQLHLRYLEDGTDVLLTDHAAYAPVIYADRLYYSSEGSLRSMGLDGRSPQEYDLPGIEAAAEFFIRDGQLVLRAVADENGPRQWTAEPENIQSSLEYAQYQGYRLCSFAGDGLWVDSVYNPDGRIRALVFTDASGNETEYFSSLGLIQ